MFFKTSIYDLGKLVHVLDSGDVLITFLAMVRDKYSEP